MGASFITYIDESGCEGFRFGKGSSDWLVLAAAIFRTSRESHDIRVIDRVRTALGKPPSADLHFQNLNHAQKVLYMDQIGQTRIRCCAALIHKPSIVNQGSLQNKNRLYHYATRLLLERVSWICAEHAIAGDGDGTSEIVFSHRRTTPTQGIQQYIEKLKTQTTEIEWRAIDPARVIAIPHKQRKGLWVADAVASGIWAGVEFNRLGFTEGRYATQLRRVIWKGRYGKCLGTGLKIWPTEAIQSLDLGNKHAWLQKEFGVNAK